MAQRQKSITDYFASPKNSGIRPASLPCSSSSLPAIRRKRRLSDSADNDDPRQTIIDAGQTVNFGLQFCHHCQLCFTGNSAEDRRQHRRHHRRTMGETTEKVPGRFTKLIHSVRRMKDGSDIYRITTESPLFCRKRVHEWCLDVAAPVLGTPTGEEGVVVVSDDRVAFVSVVAGGLLGGLLLADRILMADDGASAALGVNLIWVSSAFRRRGVATSLVDTARLLLNFGSTVPRAHVAFTGPTPEGKHFAAAYCQGEENMRTYTAVAT